MEESNSPTDTEFHEIAARNRAKLIKAAETKGYKDGAYDGRQSVFQDSFDDGYELGYRNGKQLGFHQGMAIAFAQINPEARAPDSNDLLLLKPTRGQCQVCLNKGLINNDVDDLRQVQNAHEQKCKNALEARHAHIVEFFKNRQSNTE